ncbi:hypothetical protein SLS58_004530 [Diplodia intermedia]|uniref:Uncharacterized protein n=1 Tax=Diplodia intermedia TaxID=856260 RepID=A0ABR3TUH0_9PEZI
MCYSCIDISDTVSVNDSTTPTNFTLPSGIWAGQTVLTATGIGADTNYNDTLFDFEALMLNYASNCHATGDQASPTDDCSYPQTPFAVRCSLHPCLRTYGANVTGSVYTETLVSSTNLPASRSETNGYMWSLATEPVLQAGVWRSCNTTSSPTSSNVFAVEPTNNTLVPSQSRGSTDNLTYYPDACIWAYNFGAALSLQEYLGDMFAGNALQFYATPAALVGDLWLQNLYRNGTADAASVRAYMDGLAASVTANMRARGDDNTRRAGHAAGTPLVARTCVRVRWAWLALPAALAALALGFLAALVVAVRAWEVERGSPRVAGWKSSALVPLFHGLDGRVMMVERHRRGTAGGADDDDAGGLSSVAVSRSEMQEIARRTRVRLDHEGRGLRFVETSVPPAEPEVKPVGEPGQYSSAVDEQRYSLLTTDGVVDKRAYVMESGEINKMLGVDLKWVVADRVVAAWEDDTPDHVHSLGRLSSHNKKADFSLLLGHSTEDRNACVLLFHLPLRVRPGSASKPTDLFLVLPPDTFSSPTPLEITTATTSEIPNPHLDVLRSTGLSDAVCAVRLAFNLTKPGYVLMPRIKLKHELLGTPRELLLKLRSLSQTTSFDVYLKRNTYSQVALGNFRAALLEGSASTPQLRPKLMYQGRGAKQDAWELFGGLHANNTEPGRENSLVARQDGSDREGSAPPSYKEVVKASPPPSEKPSKGPDTAEKASGARKTPDAPGQGSISVVEETPPAPTQPLSRKRTFAEAESPTASDNEVEAELRKKGSASLDDLTTQDLLREIATWMQDGWAVDTNVHQKLLVPLLALGYHAHQRNLADFDLTKGRCTSQLYIRLAAPSTQGVISLPCSPARAVIDVEEDMAHLVAWANGSVFRGAESVLREETALLGAAAARAYNGGLKAREEYVRQKALITSHAQDHEPALLPVIESPLKYAQGDDPRFGLRGESNNIELFFDLFLIANLTTFTSTHSITDTSTLVAYIGLFAIIWFTWLQITLHDVRFAMDSGYERVCKVIQFVIFVGFALVGSSFNPGGKEHNNTNFRILCIMLFISRLLLGAQYSVALFFIRRKVRGLAWPLGLTITCFILCGGAFYSMVPAFSETSGNGLGIYYVWYIIIAIEVAIVIGTACVWRQLSFKKTHLMERMGLLTLIIIGEGAIGVTKTVAKLMSKSGLTFEGCFLIVCIVLILTFLFFLYFDPAPTHHIGSIRQLLWAALHFPLHLSLIGIVEGSQQVALARYVFAALHRFQDAASRACLTEHLSGSSLAAALTAAVTPLKLDEKLESRDQVPVIMASIEAVGNVTGLCSAANTAGEDEIPDVLRAVTTDVLGGLFESIGVKPPKGVGAYESARSAYFTLYVYYWASLLIAMLCLGAIIWVVATSAASTAKGKGRSALFEKLALGSRAVVVVVAALLGAGAANRLFIYNFLGSMAVLPVVAGLLGAVVLIDRLGRWLDLRKS